MFIVSPTSGSPSAGTSTSPVSMPIRHSSAIGERARPSETFTDLDPCTNRPGASSSWAIGTPNTAATASPMNFSTRPP